MTGRTLVLARAVTKRSNINTVYAQVPPRVEYELTAFGCSLEPVLLGLRDWGEKYKRRLQRSA